MSMCVQLSQKRLKVRYAADSAHLGNLSDSLLAGDFSQLQALNLCLSSLPPFANGCAKVSLHQRVHLLRVACCLPKICTQSITRSLERAAWAVHCLQYTRLPDATSD